MKFNNFEDFFYCFADFCFVERIRYYKKCYDKSVFLMYYKLYMKLLATSSYLQFHLDNI